MSESSGQRPFPTGFLDAWRGVRAVFRSERNFRIHTAIAVVVLMSGFLFRLSALEWVSVIFACGLVFAAEIMNTAVEYLADAVHPEMDPGIRRAKDAAAGAVLMASVAAAAVGAIVFLPKLWEWLSKS